MGIDPVTIAIASFALTGASAVASNRQQSKAADEQKKVRRQQQASLAEQAAMERRQQIREERIKRARVMQAAELTGTTGSSGALGAGGALSTQFASNVGFNQSQLAGAQAISQYQQNAANAASRANDFNALGSVAGSIFNMTAPSLFQPSGTSTQQSPAPVEDRLW